MLLDALDPYTLRISLLRKAALRTTLLPLFKRPRK